MQTINLIIMIFAIAILLFFLCAFIVTVVVTIDIIKEEIEYRKVRKNAKSNYQRPKG